MVVGGEGTFLLSAPATIPVELMFARLAATEPRPAGHGLLGEAGAGENGGPQQRRNPLLTGQALLFVRDDLPGLDGSDSQEFFVDQVGARQSAVQCRAAFAQQMFDVRASA